MKIATIKESDEVMYPAKGVVIADMQDMQELKKLALLNPRQRIRLCTHPSPDHRLHEMFIIHTNDCYVRPHKHPGKAESMAILEGAVDVVLFNDDSTIRQVIKMGTPGSGNIFYYRLSEPVYHMLIIRSEFLVFHEVTEGPFIRGQTDFPEWAPLENQPEAREFMEKISESIK